MENQGGRDDERQVCPLFPEPIDDKGTYRYADQIQRFQIYRMVPGHRGQMERLKVPVGQFKREDGTFFEIQPFTTTEDDIEEHFGGGRYYIEAYGSNNRILPGGRVMRFDGPPRRFGERRQETSRGREDERDEGPADDWQDGWDDPRGAPDPYDPRMDPRTDPRRFQPPYDPRFAQSYGQPYSPYGAIRPQADPAIAELLANQQKTIDALKESHESALKEL